MWASRSVMTLQSALHAAGTLGGMYQGASGTLVWQAGLGLLAVLCSMALLSPARLCPLHNCTQKALLRPIIPPAYHRVSRRVSS